MRLAFKKVFVALFISVLVAEYGLTSEQGVVEEIKEQVAKWGGGVKPLPLAAHWNVGGPTGEGFSPEYQVRMIEQGHHLLPWFDIYAPDAEDLNSKTNRYIELHKEAIDWIRLNGLPVSFVGTQWESLLSKGRYLYAPRVDNPNVVVRSGKVLPIISPLGGEEYWRDVGREWTSSNFIRRFQEIYPDPPLVLFLSNNEHNKLEWDELDRDVRFSKRYGAVVRKWCNKSKVNGGIFGLFESCDKGMIERKIASSEWVKKYRVLLEGMRSGLHVDNWKARSLFVGYNAFGPEYMGRWEGWPRHSLYYKNKINPWADAWDGASVSYYVHNWNGSTDFTVWSPQIESMNFVFMQEEVEKSKKSFWFEMSVWDGYAPKDSNDKRKAYAQSGQEYTTSRYAGMVKFGMWLLRPRVVREFRFWDDTVANSGKYFEVILKAVDEIYENPDLARFWREGRLVPNRNAHHPYDRLIPDEYKGRDRWFLLDTSIDPPKPWKLTTEIPVYSLAIQVGKEPTREWLMYVYSPLKKRSDVDVQLPGYGKVVVHAPVSGSYYVITEKERKVKRLKSSLDADGAIE